MDDYTRIKAALAEMKKLALEMNVPIITTQQLPSRPTSQEVNREPDVIIIDYFDLLNTPTWRHEP